MTIKASGRWALIIAAAIWACLAGPLQAAEDADSAIPSVPSQATKATDAPIVLKKYTKSRHAQRKPSKAAQKSTADKKAMEADAAASSGDRSTAIPPLVANANAQLASPDTPTGSAKAMSARANNILAAAADSPPDTQPAADAQVVAADQLNDLDRALQESKPVLQENKPPAATLAMVTANAPAPVMARSDDNSTWDQTSLIGKIFIAFGALLTMASAARMFMA
jgi:hypothetical protein